MTTGTRKIGDYGLIGDGNCAALVHRNGGIDWLCWPRFDSHAVFAALLGEERNGHWTIAPADAHTATRSYHPETLVLETRFRSEAGIVVLCDFMPYQDGAQAVVRQLRCERGRMAMKMTFALRFRSGAVTPRYERQDGGLRCLGENLALCLQSSHQSLVHADKAVSFEIGAGEEIDFILTDADRTPRDPASFSQAALDRCVRFWTAWAERCVYSGPWRQQVVRSLITLKALIYAPSGGIVAASTTSLPEAMGGHRNWDYRFCWLRDSTFTVLALLHAGYADEAAAWTQWLLRAISPPPARAKTLYGIAQDSCADEHEIAWLDGFNGSRPVRFGNDARKQVQLGIYGEVQDTLYQWRRVQAPKIDTGWKEQCSMLSHLTDLWHEPDAGIWEQRGHLEAFTQSRALAWCAFDRAIRSAEEFQFEGPLSHWRELRERIHRQVCDKGFDPELNAFARAYGSRSFDASTLLLSMVGFLPPRDPRIRGTVEGIRRNLSAGPFVYRYDQSRESDGIGGAEGAFLPCSFWLADNFVLQDRPDDAAGLFEALLGTGNDLGLFSEEYDVSEKVLLGNFPQALTHLSLVHTALNLTGEGPAHLRSNTGY